MKIDALNADTNSMEGLGNIDDIKLGLSEVCKNLAESGACLNNQKEMFENCRQECIEWEEKKRHVQRESIDEEDRSLYELNAIDHKGRNMSFEDFEGYITIIVNMPKLCGKTRIDTEKSFEAVEQLKKIWPYALNIVLFPFDMPGVNYSLEDCTQYEEAFHKDRIVHVMKSIEINGPNTHPVYKYMKNLFKIGEDDMQIDMATFYIISPDGNIIESHYGHSYELMKSYIRNNLRTNYPEL